MSLTRFYTKTKLDVFLAGLAVTCLWLMLSASSDPVLPWLRGAMVAAAFEQFTTGNQIAFDLSVGVLSAIGMFYLLVRLPEYERKSRIKRHLQFSYQSFKRSVIQIFVGAIQGAYSTETVDKLMEQRQFRDFFKEPFAPGQDKWHGVANALRQLVIEAEVLLNQFQHALSVVDIRDPEVFSFITRISEALYRAKNWSSDYDGTKEVLRFFWSILSGWSFVDGYTEREYIPEMIDKL
ncbi:MAG: hypothetical protein ABL925_18175 [Methylococcales bacterium]